MVNSPSTSATEMNAADRTPGQMLGTITRAITVNQLAPSDRAASASVVASSADSADVDRAVGVRQHQHDVDEGERQRRSRRRGS